MLWKVLFLSALAACMLVADGQPVSCNDEDQCSEGYYCERDFRICKECLSCKDLNREPLPKYNACITSVAECGACFEGLAVDRLGDVNAPCVMSVPEESEGTPRYVWWLGSIVIIFVILVIGIMLYICMNPGIFEHFKLGGSCPSGTVSTNIRTQARASAPEAPPPYAPPHFQDFPYSAVRTESPCPPPHEPRNTDNVFVEEEGPFIKPSGQPRPPGAREAAGRQAARVFNVPFYAREEPPSPEPPMVTEVTDNLAIHDEETMESTWSPNATTNGDINANVDAPAAVPPAPAASVPALVVAARDNSLFDSVPPKRLCVRTNSNYSNRDSNPSGDNSQGNFSGTQNGAPYNIITNITNLVQFNRTA